MESEHAGRAALRAARPWAWLAAAGITAEVTPVAVDMETAFAFLAELGAAA